MSLLASLRDFCRQNGLEKTYWIALSGGLDSQVLLSLCHALREEFGLTLRVIHVNHGLSIHAKTWAARCAQVCQEYGIDYTEREIHLDLKAGDSLEEAAREARYACFADCLGEDDILLTAHHQDDQAETVLIQLLRGAGLKGLAAMPAIKPFARGFHGRPLLASSRSLLQQYASEQQLQWVDDESNQQIRFTRNFIRHEILSRLKIRWETVANTISRSALHCSEAQSLLEEFAQEICQSIQGSREHTLSVKKLLQLDPKKQKLTLRTWIQLRGYPLPDANKLQAVLSHVLSAATDRMPSVHWRGVEIRRYRDDLYLLTSLPYHDSQRVIEWNLNQSTLELAIGTLHAIKAQAQGIRATIQTISIRFRQGGEKAALSGRGRHTLKNLWQEWGVPPWLRDRVPLVFSDEKLIGAVGYFIDEAYTAKEGEMGWVLKIEGG